MAPAAAPTAAPKTQTAEISAAPPSATTLPATSPIINQTQPANSHDAAIRAAAANELGPKVAASMPTVPPSTPPEPVDAGAAKLVASIANVLGDRSLPNDGVTIINLRGVQNLSRSNADEFGSFMHRFCEVMSKAGKADRIAFTDNAEAEAQYRMQGTAYMIYASGFDQWEMYLTLRPADREFDIWDAGSAVRVLRIARPGAQQIMYEGK